MAELSDVKWKEFSLTEIFPIIKRGKRLKKSDHLSGAIPYVSSTATSNGVDGFIGNQGRDRTPPMRPFGCPTAPLSWAEFEFSTIA